MNYKDIIRFLENDLGLIGSHEPSYATEYVVENIAFYVKSAATGHLVVHPDWQEKLRHLPIDGVIPNFWPDNTFYKSTSLRKFPHSEGKQKSHCGCDLRVQDTIALEAILARIGVLSYLTTLQAKELEDIRAAETPLTGLTKTERTALMSARLGQGQFRKALMKAWSRRCAVTGTSLQDLLRASHIKPWRISNNNERLNPENGLLLVATLDAAFDAGLISFEDDGTMLFSSRLDPNPRETLCISAGSVLTRTPSPEQQTFLNHHRKAVFK